MADTDCASTKKLDRAGVVEIYDVLGSIKGAFDSVQHRWKAAALRRQFKDIAETIVEIRDDSQKLIPTDFQAGRETLCRALAAKNKDGAPIIAGQAYIIAEGKQAEFDTSLGALRDKHKESIDAYDAEIKRINEFLHEEIDVPKTTITFKLSWFNKTATQEMFEVLFDYVEDDTDAAEAAKAEKVEKK